MDDKSHDYEPIFLWVMKPLFIQYFVQPMETFYPGLLRCAETMNPVNPASSSWKPVW